MIPRTLLPLLLLAPTPLLAIQDPEPAADEAPAAPSYLRLVEEDDTLRLELAVRTFQRKDGQGPELVFVSAMHIGDAAYYSALQERMAACDVVLFEGVKPTPRAEDFADVDAPAARARIAATRRRMRVVAIELARHRRAAGAYPTELSQLGRGLEGDARKLLDRALLDAWERPLTYRAIAAAEADAPGSFELVSLGADGAAGGSGAARDLAFAEQEPVQEAEAKHDLGIQKDLADALGLVFQLEGIDYLGAKWRNSDMTVDELTRRLEADGGGGVGDDLLDMLGGEGFVSNLAGGLLKLLGRTQSGAGMMKLMGIEVLGRADQVFENPPPGMANLFEVLLDGRNDVVAADLRKVFENEPDVKSVAIFYGAAHMPALESVLAKELELEQKEEAWLTGVQVDLNDLGLPRSMVNRLRKTLNKALDSQLGR